VNRFGVSAHKFRQVSGFALTVLRAERRTVDAKGISWLDIQDHLETQPQQTDRAGACANGTIVPALSAGCLGAAELDVLQVFLRDLC
jgi:hypothetical protein